MHTHYRAPCGYAGKRMFPRTTNAAQLFRPRGDECDGCQRDGVVQYAEGGVEGPLCRVVPYGAEKGEAPKRTRRRVETAVGDERERIQESLF